MAEPQPYGPNSALVRRFLQRFAALRPADWEKAATAYDRAQRDRGFAAADRALAAAIAGAGRDDARDAVLGPLAQLAQRSALAGDADESATPALDPAAEAALAALLALIVRDLLPAATFAALYAPFDVLIPLETLELA